MLTLSEVLRVLDSWSDWKRLKQTPGELDALRSRIERLEASLAGRSASAEACPRCHAAQWQLDRTESDPTFGDLGVQRRVYVCRSCGHTEYKQLK